MFGTQLGYEEQLMQKLHRVLQFLLTAYSTAWLRAPVASEAPANDLRLHRTLVGYRRVDFEVAEAAIEVLKRHLGYLRPEIMVFSLFGEQVSLDEKAEMSRRLLATPRHYDGDYSPSAVVLDDTTTLADLIDEGLWLFFELTATGHTWLTTPPEKWSECEDFCALNMFVHSVKVTNDVAERGICMLKSFAGSVKDESHFQWLLQAVERHRARLLDLTKTALNRL